MKNLLVLLFLALSGCGFGTTLCKGLALGALDKPKDAIEIAEKNLERGFAWGQEIVSLRTENLNASTDDPLVRTVNCMRSDSSGIDRQYKCFHRVQLQWSGDTLVKLDIYPLVERRIIEEQTVVAAELQSGYDRKIAECES